MTTIIERQNFYARVFGPEAPIGLKGCEWILERVCDVSGIPEHIIKSKTRVTEVKEWRQLVHYICHHKKMANLKTIGRVTGGHDHSTVIHSTFVVSNLLKAKDPQLMRKFNLVKFLL